MSIVFLNDSYIIGACINSYLHNCYLLNLNIRSKVDLIIFIDQNLVETYGNILKRFYNKVIPLDITKNIYKINPKYYFSIKY